MKKLFISCPMFGRKEENILKSIDAMHKVAEVMFGEELEVISDYVVCETPENQKDIIKFTSKQLDKLADADYYIGHDCNRFYHDCEYEIMVARRVGIPTRIINCRHFKCFDDIMRT